MTEQNLDTQLLASELRQAYDEVLLYQVLRLDDEAYEAAWYRVAERAKEFAERAKELRAADETPHRHVWPDWGTRQCVHCGEPQSEAAR